MRYIITYSIVSGPDPVTFYTYWATMASNPQEAREHFMQRKHRPGYTVLKVEEADETRRDMYGMGWYTDEERAAHEERMEKKNAAWRDEHSEARRRVEGYSLEEFAAEQEYQARRAAEGTSNLDGVHVGDIFCSCWGYDQTNYDFYQVVEVKGKHTVIVQENTCNAQMCSDYSGYKRPIRDHFASDQRYTLRTCRDDYRKGPTMRNPELQGRHMMEPVTFGTLYQHSTGA